MARRTMRWDCAPTWIALHIHRKSGVAHASTHRGQDACVRPRRPHVDAARRAAARWRSGRISTAPRISSSSPPRKTKAAAASWCRRASSTAFPMKAVYGMHNWPGTAGRARSRSAPGPLHGRVRHLRDRRDRPAVRTPRMPHLGRDPMPLRRACHQCAADDRRAQHPSARSRRRQRHASARRRHVERDPAGSRAARHGARRSSRRSRI